MIGKFRQLSRCPKPSFESISVYLLKCSIIKYSIKIPAILGIILSCVIVGFGQPSWSHISSALASSVGFALFWLSIWPLKKKQRCLIAFIWFILVQSIQLSWMTSSEYHGMYIWFVYFGIAFWLGAQFALLTFFLPLKKNISILHCLALTSFWVLMEWGRLFIICGFPFNPTGLSLTYYAVPTQMASIVGVFGLSFWVFFVNFLCVKIFFSKKKKKAVFFWASFSLIPYLFGMIHIQYHQMQKGKMKTIEYHVALIQTAVRPEQKIPLFSRLQDFIPPLNQWERIIKSLEREKVKDLDLIVLPEAAVSFEAFLPLYPYEQVKEFLFSVIKNFSDTSLPTVEERENEEVLVSNSFIAQALSNHYSAECIIGFDDSVTDANHNFTSAFHFLPHQTRVDRYEKQILVPLAEYLPFSFLSSIVGKYGISEFYSSGKEARIFSGKTTISPSICYEECFGHIMRRGKIKGAKMFVNITNDNYFPFSKLPKQHFDHGKLRAIENGVPLLRACNTGVTAAVDSLGKIINTLEDDGDVEWVQGALILRVNGYNYQSLYSLWGDTFIISLCIGFLILFLFINSAIKWSRLPSRKR